MNTEKFTQSLDYELVCYEVVVLGGYLKIRTFNNAIWLLKPSSNVELFSCDEPNCKRAPTTAILCCVQPVRSSMFQLGLIYFKFQILNLLTFPFATTLDTVASRFLIAAFCLFTQASR